MNKWRKWLNGAITCAMAAVMFCSCSIFDNGNDSSSSSEQSSETEAFYTVKFDLLTDLKTNNIMDQEVRRGDVVTKPVVAVLGENPNNLEVEGWYTDSTYTEQWNFLTDVVESDMTLYAKWIGRYTVNYYLGDNLTTPMHTETYLSGETLRDMSTLSDGYRSEGFFLDSNYTQKLQSGTQVNENLNIYIQRSDSFYFSADMIDRRFVPTAASSGGGSTAGSLEYVEDGDESYVKANFGYSTAADPHLLLKNVTVDISSSQKIRITFKNMGNADRLKLYFVAWYDDTSKEPVDEAYFTEKTAYTYMYTQDERNMSEDSEWLVKEFDLAEATIQNGVSLWGNASTLIQLRIDSSYISSSEDDLSNELWIRSIEGVADDTYVNTEDSASVTALLKNDEAAAVKAAADDQQDVVGWIFPKNNAQVSGSATTYEKTSGLLMYSAFRQTGATLIFNPSENETIDMDELTTLKIRLKNYGYGSTLKIAYRNKLGRSAECTLSVNPKSDSTEYTLNMFGASNWNGKLDTLSIVYDSVGVDNALLIESIEFSEFKAVQIPGINFNDKNLLGITDTEQLSVSYDSIYAGTKFNVLTSGASFEKTYETRFTTIGYESMTLNYAAANGIGKVIVALTTANGDGEAVVKEYVYEVAAGNGVQSVQVPFEANGLLQKIKVTFEGVGEITICNLKFNLPTTALDYAESGFVSMVAEQFKWATSTSFDDGLTAAKYSQNGSTEYMNAYMGAMYNAGIGNGSFSLKGKTKLVIIYQNRGTATVTTIGLGITELTADDSWKGEISQPGARNRQVTIAAEMGEDEWLAAEIDLTEFSDITAENIDNLALTCIFCFFANTSYVGSLYVRGISVI